MKENIDWNNLGFEYRKANQMFVCRYKDGKWGKGEMVAEDTLKIHVSATALHLWANLLRGAKSLSQQRRPAVFVSSPRERQEDDKQL